MFGRTLSCPHKRSARCKFTARDGKALVTHVKNEHPKFKMPKANKGMAHCVWPGCSFEHEHPSKVLQHLETSHKD